jgi:LPS-assembly protein
VSNTRGTVLGDAFYWVISRNADATIGASIYSKRGPAEAGNLRWVGFGSVLPGPIYAVQDNKGNPQTGQNQGGEEFKAYGFRPLPDGFCWCSQCGPSLVLRSSAWRSPRAYRGHQLGGPLQRFLIQELGRLSFGAIASRYQNYESTAGDDISIVHAPSVEFSTAERPFSRSNFVYSYDAAIEGVNRSEIGFETAPIVGRIDAAPYIAWPKLFRGWTVRPQIGARETFYTEQLEPSSNPSPDRYSDPGSH